MTPQNTSDTGERVSTFVSTLANFEGLKFRITLFLRAKMKKERVIGIEPNDLFQPRPLLVMPPRWPYWETRMTFLPIRAA